jgi:hypothetical protein
MTLTPATATTEIDTTTPELAKLGRMVIEQLQNSGGAIRQIQDSMGAVQGSDVTATQNVSMSDSMGAVQGSDVTATQSVSMSESMGAVQGPYETTTGCVRIPTLGGAVQSSKEVKPKGNMGNKLKAPPLEPTRYGTRQRKSVEHLEL